jgi:hypothetical protein
VAAALFDAGVSIQRQLAEARQKVRRFVTAEPTWADSYYDRALVRIAQGDPRRAQTDFEEYLRLKPQAPDRAEVVARIETLRQRPLSATQALGLGLIVPGGGQFYTRRPIRGALFFAGAATAIGFAIQQQSSRETVEETALIRLETPTVHNDASRHGSTSFPGCTPAPSWPAAGAFMFAKLRSADVQRVSVSLSPSAGGLAARVRLQLR